MDGKQQQRAMDIEQNETAWFPRNPHCSNEGAHCGCRCHSVACQPQQVAKKTWSLWKTFLVCLLACIVATTIAVLVFYFVHFDKSTSNTTIIIHADGKSSYVTCIPGSTPSPVSTTPPVPLSTPPSTPMTSQSSSTSITTSAMVTTIATTTEHEVEIED
ncbi:dynactin-associated protein-like [Castor canadensis]